MSRVLRGVLLHGGISVLKDNKTSVSCTFVPTPTPPLFPTSPEKEQKEQKTKNTLSMA